MRYLLTIIVTLAVIALFAFGAAKVGACAEVSYSEAHALSMKDGKPLLILVSTEWCAPCQIMHRRVMPQVIELPSFKAVHYATVNPDYEWDQSQALIGNGRIPELLIYFRGERGWMRRVLVGSQSVEAVDSMIQASVQDSKGAKP